MDIFLILFAIVLVFIIINGIADICGWKTRYNEFIDEHGYWEGPI